MNNISFNNVVRISRFLVGSVTAITFWAHRVKNNLQVTFIHPLVTHFVNHRHFCRERFQVLKSIFFVFTTVGVFCKECNHSAALEFRLILLLYIILAGVSLATVTEGLSPRPFSFIRRSCSVAVRSVATAKNPSSWGGKTKKNQNISLHYIFRFI